MDQKELRTQSSGASKGLLQKLRREIMIRDGTRAVGAVWRKRELALRLPTVECLDLRLDDHVD